MWRQKRHIRDLYDMKHWSERAVIALVMQSRDNSIQVFTKAGRFGRRVLSSRQGHGEPNPTWIPVANQAVRRMAEIMGGFPGRLDRRAVQHAADRPLHRRLHDRRLARRPASSTPTSASTATPACTSPTARRSRPTSGVNPSLTITAQAERAMAFWPNKGEADPRPALGTAYQRISPVAPKNPVVPEAAPGALRLPIVAVS